MPKFLKLLITPKPLADFHAFGILVASEYTGDKIWKKKGEFFWKIGRQNLCLQPLFVKNFLKFSICVSIQRGVHGNCVGFSWLNHDQHADGTVFLNFFYRFYLNLFGFLFFLDKRLRFSLESAEISTKLYEVVFCRLSWLGRSDMNRSIIYRNIWTPR